MLLFQIHKPLFTSLRKLPLKIIFFLSSSIFALPTDQSKPVELTSDSTTINYKTGIYTYEGNVRIIQGTTQLLADRVITKNNSHHKLEEAIAYGFKKNAEYSTIPKEGDLRLHALAKIIRYYPIKKMVSLEDDAEITQGENSFHGAKVVYNIKDQVISAPAIKNQRATIIIEPKQLN